MEPGIDLSGWGAVLVGVAAVIGSLASFYMAVRNTKKIRSIDKKTEDIDHAVNGRPLGAQTLQSQVSDLHSDRPPPPQLPEEMQGVAIRDKLDLLLADMYERRKR